MKKNCLILLLIPSLLFSEKIILKDGGVVRGRVVEENATELIISNEYGNITIEKDNIKKRIKDSRDRLSFKNSKYSFKKRSWPKYAFLGTVITGVITTTIIANLTSITYTDKEIYTYSLSPAWISAISFTTVALGFAALDYFKYGRVPKRRLRKFSMLFRSHNKLALYHPTRFNTVKNHPTKQESIWQISFSKTL